VHSEMYLSFLKG